MRRLIPLPNFLDYVVSVASSTARGFPEVFCHPQFQVLQRPEQNAG